MQGVARRQAPRLRKSDPGIPWIFQRTSQRHRAAVPTRSRLLIMKSPAPRQAQLDLAERLVPGVFHLIVRLDSNARLRAGFELHAYFLFFDGVAGAERRDACCRPERGRCGKQREAQARMPSGNQNASIVTGKSWNQKPRVKIFRPPRLENSKGLYKLRENDSVGS